MRISQVKLKNFRNFSEATINFAQKTLIIGANDVGKTNLLYAIRLLLDRTLSEADIEPGASDFFAYEEEVTEFSIMLTLEGVTDNIRAKFKEHVSEEGRLILKYEARRELESGKIDAQFYQGRDESNLEPIDGRFYLRTLNIRYVGSNRDLSSYIRREKSILLQNAKDARGEQEIETDNVLQERVKTNLREINNDIEQMHYIQNATNGLNREMEELSFRHEGQRVVFEVGASDPGRFIDGAHLATRVNGCNLNIGGDGRNNQIFLSLWAAKNRIEDGDKPVESIICAIEEPEAHLHPHQQRKLAAYLATSLQTQVIITSHSPEIAGKFAPNAIVRLKSAKLKSSAASDGCTPAVTNSFINFGHRLNAIASEAFFADVVFLVEGQSEVLFYKALADSIGIDLDRYNITILMVDGVGFKPYMEILDTLEIRYVIRTDNDLIKIPRREFYRLAGTQRAFDLFLTREKIDPANPPEDIDPELAELIGSRPSLTNLAEAAHGELQPSVVELMTRFKSYLANKDIYISNIDLEHDLCESAIESDIIEFIREFEDSEEVEDPIGKMQKQKATFMYRFLLEKEGYKKEQDGHEKEDCLLKLANDQLAAPLNRCLEIAKSIFSTEQNV